MELVDKIRGWVLEHKLDIAIVVGIFIVAALARVLDLGTFLTADEKNWLGRGYEYIRAFKDMRFNDMLQTTHPGATALWLIGTSVTAKIVLSGIPFSFQTLPAFVVAAQLPIALANSAIVAISYCLLLRLQLPSITTQATKRFFSAFAALAIALSPFIVGYSRVAHVDALLGGFLLLAVLSTIIWLQQGFARKYLVASMAFSALALTTKAPAVFMVPFFVLTAIVGGLSIWSTGNRKEYMLARVRDFIIWSIGIAILFVLIWPVFITVQNPKGNLNILRKDLTTAAATPHHMSESYTLEGSHYIKTILVRTTPATLLLFIASIGVVIFLIRAKGTYTHREGAFLLFAYVFFFLVMMTLGAKKGDRYILPVFFAIDILAVYAIFAISSLLKKERYAAYASGAFVLILLTTVASYHPYAIAYANPLFPDNLSQELGWGEGLEQVGAWLSENAPHARVAAWYDQELGAYTSANVLTIGAHAENTVQYVVLYKNMFGRAADHPANDYIDEYYKKRKPVFVATVHDKEFAWVYEKKTYPSNYGEILPGERIVRELPVTYDPLGGVQVLVATYRGRATSGLLHVEIVHTNGERVYAWVEPIAEFKDDLWHSFKLPEQLSLQGENVRVRVFTSGTALDDAPTIRRDAAGNAAIRLLYDTGTQLIHEEHTKLLEQL